MIPPQYFIMNTELKNTLVTQLPATGLKKSGTTVHGGIWSDALSSLHLIFNIVCYFIPQRRIADPYNCMTEKG